MLIDDTRLESLSERAGPSPDVLIIEDLDQQRLPASRLASVLERAGWRTQLVQFGSNTDPSEVIAIARDTQPRLIVFSVLFADRVTASLNLISSLRRTGVKAHITMAGPIPSFAYVDLLNACPALDSVICGEAEGIVASLAASAHDPRRWRAVEGIAYRSPSPRANPPLDAAIRLDDLPFPMRFADAPPGSDCGFATIEGSRGCYRSCNFCLPCAFYKSQRACYRLRSIPNLADEIELLYSQGTRLFLFDDEQFLPPARLRTERVASLGRELEQRALRIAFTIKCRTDDVEAVLFGRLKEIGLIRVYVGIESGCQSTLDLLGKGVGVNRNAKALATLDSLGIVTDFRTLIFHPWTTYDSICHEIDFLERVLPHVSTCFTFREVEIYPGTELAARLIKEERAVGEPWRPGYTIEDSRAEMLRRLCNFAYSASGMHPKIAALLTQAWFDLLLQQRFESGKPEASRMNQLKNIAFRVNRTSLDVWGEMLAFVRDGNIRSVNQVNDLAADCAGRINAACAQIEDEVLCSQYIPPTTSLKWRSDR